ncbi:MAG TPA: tripartite tricarboxylate transporter substrate-binding protein [Alphaproteobacteria bacterium]|nr:tripartite tricarboxylate transporter substrate-binding protein [Alphaproteobacteria bacterium]
MSRFAFAVVAACLIACAGDASAQSDAEFYRGKTVHLVLSTGVGGGYAVYGRLLARHMDRHLPGQPNIIVENMPGAGGVKATNWMYVQAPRDGTTFGIVQVTVPLAPLMGNKGAQYDATRFNWLGSIDQAPAVCMAWHTAPVKTWDDLRKTEFIAGGTGVGSSMLIYPALLNASFGTKFRVIAGYADGSSVYLAMERGEVYGACGAFLTTIKATLPEWFTDHKFVVPIVIAPHRLQEFPDSPAITEFITDELTRQIFEIPFATEQMDRPVLAPPGLPTARVADLRKAFVDTMNDPAFRDEAARLKLTIDFVDGVQLSETIKNVYALPPEAIAAARAAMGNRSEGD